MDAEPLAPAGTSSPSRPSNNNNSATVSRVTTANSFSNGHQAAMAPAASASLVNAANHQLPPYPPPPPPYHLPTTRSSGPWHDSLRRKYVILCIISGSLSIFLGFAFSSVYAIARGYTSSLQYIETIPMSMPALLFLVNGIITICFAKRKLRTGVMMKLAGMSCLMVALLCAAMTVTTTVVHLSRIQNLRECFYSQSGHSCHCFIGDLPAGYLSAQITPTSDSDAAQLPFNASISSPHRIVFKDTPSCDAIQSGLFLCLRVLFGLSVFGILACVFASMLIYQLSSHEKKKVYFQQLETRRRFQSAHCQRTRSSAHHSHAAHAAHLPVQHAAHCNCYHSDGLYPSWFPPPFYPWDSWDQSHSTIGEPRSHPNANASTGFFSRLFRRNETPSTTNYGLWNVGPLSLPPHSFIPRMSGSNLSTLQPSRSTRTTGRHRAAPGQSHRLRHSRGQEPMYHMPAYPMHLAGSPFILSPAAMWGPPPPYQPCADPNSQLIVAARSRPVSVAVDSSGAARHQRQASLSSIAERCSSKISTPLSERRMFCKAFASDGVTLTVGNSDVNYINCLAPSSPATQCTVQVHPVREHSPASLAPSK
ncbi:hypothetical protein HDE_06889 [Halotydeus destructor]|nr:hypothetical protein HDE_06889 [Halotydeus destructor]